MKEKVLLLGVTGRIGGNFVNDYLQNGYDKDYELILGARHLDKLKDEKFGKFKTVHADLASLQSLKKAMKGIDVVLNLAANAEPDAKFKDLLKPNIIGTYNLFEAAHAMKVKRVITMSSIHAVKGYKESKIIKEIDAPKPLNLYGATKAFVESLAHVYYKKYGLSCIVIRIGAYVSDDLLQKVCFTRENYDYIISQRDMAQLFHKTILSNKKLKYAVLSGISDNRKKRLDLKRTMKLVGYNPEDDAYELCESVKKNKG